MRLTEADITAGWKSNGPPLVSVMCITYNQCLYVTQALEGILMQRTDFPFEIVVHDDASTDCTQEVIRKFAERYPKIIRPILRRENIYSKGFKIQPIVMPHTKGKYIAFCEGDDFWTDPLKLQKQINILAANRNVFICGHWTTNVDEHGNLLQVQAYTGVDCPQRFDLGNSLSSTVLHPNTWMYRRLDWSKELHYDLLNRLPAGDDPSMLMFLNHGKGYCLQEFCSAYRLHSGGTWSTQKDYIQSFKMLQFRIASFDMIPIKYYPRQTLNVAAGAFNTLLQVLMAIVKKRCLSPVRELNDVISKQRTMSAKHLIFSLVVGLIFAPLFITNEAFPVMKLCLQRSGLLKSNR